ncbi:ATP-dependent Lon protease [Lysinibacillus composti]|uniref:Lon protease n=1 Tax=Lysinibacillus composti TaxID=720633 RepID=A0A3N9UKH8_9BACI|nr:endopeptidase La [Lysinibacillus composti]MBM7606927.1 ATP-dependent Lon protease [Lysinibacillus composti]RQW76469.1 endopeptidase La [Lysinibacillus composti]
MDKMKENIPLLPLRGLLVYPSMVLHIDVGRARSVAALEHAMVNDNQIFLATQKDLRVEQPTQEELYTIGTLVNVKQMLKLPNGTLRILVEGISRAKIVNYAEEEDFTIVDLEIHEDDSKKDAEIEALMRTLISYFEKYAKSSNKITTETIESVIDIDEPGRLTDIIASHLPLKIAEKQEILSIFNVKKRLDHLIIRLHDEQEVLNLEKKINSKVKQAMERTQKEYYLREQMKAIQSELGDRDGKSGEVADLRKRVDESGMPESTKKIALKELDRYEKLPAASAESGVIRNYLEWLVTLPWTESTTDRLDIAHAEEILNRDHDGLEKVKERILEYLSVRQLMQTIKGPILCLVGPPGVGKTSLARSVAESLDRNFVRISLGGVRDESEIRGHRRTYVGAMPGRIIQGMKKAGTINPVFLLDEIDKMSNDFRGDPSAAMLEVLDPEQNNTFSDHYLEEPYDLSKVLFIATANDLSTIPGPLLDRMEVISIAGYTEIEKIAITQNHLIPKQLKENGLKKSQLVIKDEAVVDLIRYYTREAGVRNLQRQIAALCRKAAKIIVSGDKKRVTVNSKVLIEMLGKHKFRYGQAETENQIGVATGLAYTTVGGDTLQIEVSITAGKGKLQLTGKLGDVMKESAQTALSYVRSLSDKLEIDADFFDKHDIHIHVPEGAVPKDGPSAGITMTTALVSAISNKPIKREIGMTGEITLRGRVLPIGGLKEKSLGAHRAGLTTIIIPKDNERDIDDIPETIREQLTFKPVSSAEEVLDIALMGGF